jgi:predicted thioredoxin/glutaredoxin
MEQDLAIAIARLEEQILAIYRVRDIDQNSAANALEIQRVEMARRLDLLNGEQERIANVLAKSVTREMFDLQMGELMKRMDKMERVAWLPLLIIGGGGATLGGLMVRFFLGQ